MRIPSVCFLGALLVSATALRSADQDRWWPDYAGGPASARYFEATQITRANVSRLAIAWTYPYGETNSNPLVAGGVIYGRGRNGSLIAIDAKTGKEIWIREGMQAMTARGMNYWEGKDGKDRRLIFAMNDYLQEINAATGQPIYEFGKDGVVDLREGLGRDPATIGRIQSGTPGRIFENLILIGSATGRGLHVAAGRSACLRRDHRKARVAVPHGAASGRVRLRDLAEGRLQVRWRRQHVG